MARKLVQEYDRTSVAYHEAGHAVIFFCLSKRIDSISIVPHREESGLVSLGRVDSPCLFAEDRKLLADISLAQSYINSGRHDRQSENHLMNTFRRWKRAIGEHIEVLMGGLAADCIRRGDLKGLFRIWLQDFYGASNDYDDALAQAMIIDEGDKKRAIRRVLEGLSSSKKLLERPQNWQAVELIAAELLKRSELTGKKARQLFRLANRERGTRSIGTAARQRPMVKSRPRVASGARSSRTKSAARSPSLA